MKIEVYLSKGEREGMIKAELYIDGFNPARAIPVGFPKEKIPELVRNFYEELEAGGVPDIRVEVRNKGLESSMYENIENKISLILRSRKAVLN